MLHSLRFVRIPLGILLVVLLAASVSALHFKSASAAPAVCTTTTFSLNSDTKKQNVSFFDLSIERVLSYTLTEHSVLKEIAPDNISVNCKTIKLFSETTVILSDCQPSAFVCEDDGTATAFLVAPNGTRPSSVRGAITVANAVGFSTSESVTSRAVAINCGAAGGTYSSSTVGTISLGSAQKCG